MRQKLGLVLLCIGPVKIIYNTCLFLVMYNNFDEFSAKNHRTQAKSKVNEMILPVSSSILTFKIN